MRVHSVTIAIVFLVMFANGAAILAPATGTHTSAIPLTRSVAVMAATRTGARRPDLVPVAIISTLPVPTVALPTLLVPTVPLRSLASTSVGASRTGRLPVESRSKCPKELHGAKPCPSPTVALPTAALPTLSVPTAALPTAALPTLPVPTAALPTAALPTLPVPTVALPTAQPTATTGPRPQPTATTGPRPQPTATTGPRPQPTATTGPRPQPTATPTVVPLSATPTTTPMNPSAFATRTPPGQGAVAAPTRTPTSQGVVAAPRPTPVPPGGGGPAPRPTTTAPPDAGAASLVRTPPSLALDLRAAHPGVPVAVTGQDFGPAELITLALDGAALTTRPAIIVSDARGRFAASFIAPRSLFQGGNTVAASGAMTGRSAIATLTGIPGVASYFYFAGGENTATVRASLALLNSDERPARVQLTFYGQGGITITRAVTIAATRERTLSVSDLAVFPGLFGLAVRADHAIAATLTLARAGRDGDILLGSPDLAMRWYLAEGYTSLTFQETVAILNPARTAARVTVRLLPTNGRPARAVTLRVAAHSEAIAHVNRLLPHQALSMIVDSDQPVVVARALTFSSDRSGQGFGLTLRTGSTTPATTWFFAEGSTRDRFQTFLTVLNPNRTRVRVTARFYGAAGQTLGARTLLVGAGRRGTLTLNTFLTASGIASVVNSDRPVVVERAEYFGSPNSPHIAGSAVFGRNGPATRWSFPGGAGLGMDEFLQLYNPSARTVAIAGTFYRANGKTQRFLITVRPHVHYTIIVRRVARDYAPEHGVTLQATNGQGFVAEQTLFTPDHRTLLSTQGFAQ